MCVTRKILTCYGLLAKINVLSTHLLVKTNRTLVRISLCSNYSPLMTGTRSIASGGIANIFAGKYV